MPITAGMSIAISVLAPLAVGETIEKRFNNVVQPANLEAGCWMTTTEDEQFRSAVGAVMMSYGPGTPEFERIEKEMRMIQQLSAMLTAAEVGLSTSLPEVGEDHQPIGLMGLWKNRQR